MSKVSTSFYNKRVLKKIKIHEVRLLFSQTYTYSYIYTQNEANVLKIIKQQGTHFFIFISFKFFQFLILNSNVDKILNNIER